MIHHLRHGDIDKARWDARVAALGEPLWYAVSEVLDAVAPDWEALWDDATDTVMPLTHRRKWGFSYLYQPFAIQRLGPMGPAVDAATVGAFLIAVPAHFKLWDIHLDASASEGHPSWVHLEQRTTMELPLVPDVTALRAAYGQGHKRGLRKWAQEGEVCEMAPEAFLEVLEHSPRLRSWKVNYGQLATLHAVLQVADSRGELQCLGLRVKGEWGAVASFVTWGGRTIFLKGISTEAGRGIFALHRVLDHAIGLHAGRSKLFDLAGGHDAELRRFYGGFGARPRLYLHAKVNRLPQPLRWYKQRSDGA